jgi:N-acetylneuraminic acid mutarotase
MNFPRIALGVGTVKGRLYAIGGVDSTQNVLKTVERYDPGKGIWERVRDMNVARGGMAIVVLNGRLYAIGGFSRVVNRISYWHAAGPLATVEEYNPDTDTWTERAPMLTARYDLTAGAIGSTIYAVGGMSDETSFDLVEAYDPTRDARWTTRTPAPELIVLAGGGVVDGSLYVLAGYYSSSTLVYNPALDTPISSEVPAWLSSRGIRPQVPGRLVRPFARGADRGPGRAVANRENNRPPRHLYMVR